jgi:hypothetical protein
MKKTLFTIAIIAGLLFCVSQGASAIAYNGIADPNGRILVLNADGSLNVVSTATGTITTTVSLVADFDPVNYSVPATSASGTNLNAPATATFFVLVNESTQTLRVCFACTASATTGLYVPSGGSVSADNISLKALSVYNSGALVAPVSIMYGRKP